MEKQNVTGARKGVCLVRDKGLRRKKAALPGTWGCERTKQEQEEAPAAGSHRISRRWPGRLGAGAEARTGTSRQRKNLHRQRVPRHETTCSGAKKSFIGAGGECAGVETHMQEDEADRGGQQPCLTRGAFRAERR